MAVCLVTLRQSTARGLSCNKFFVRAKDLQARYAQVREAGYAVSTEDFISDVAAVAAPVEAATRPPVISSTRTRRFSSMER